MDRRDHDHNYTSLVAARRRPRAADTAEAHRRFPHRPARAALLAHGACVMPGRCSVAVHALVDASQLLSASVLPTAHPATHTTPTKPAVCTASALASSKVPRTAKPQSRAVGNTSKAVPPRCGACRHNSARWHLVHHKAMPRQLECGWDGCGHPVPFCPPAWVCDFRCLCRDKPWQYVRDHNRHTAEAHKSRVGCVPDDSLVLLTPTLPPPPRPFKHTTASEPAGHNRPLIAPACAAAAAVERRFMIASYQAECAKCGLPVRCDMRATATRIAS